MHPSVSDISNGTNDNGFGFAFRVCAAAIGELRFIL